MLPHVGTNKLAGTGRLAQPGDSTDQAVVLPNVDTLYASAIFDLSEYNVEVTIPAVQPGRYYNFGFYDP